MISMQKYFGHNSMADVSMTHKQNAEILLPKVNLLSLACKADLGIEFEQTSGFRSMQDHLRIYSEINAQRSKQGLPALSIPMGSRHLSAEAIDVRDTDNSKKKWLKENDSEKLKALGLWCEDGTDGWLHLQTQPPKSGRRWFLP